MVSDEPNEHEQRGLRFELRLRKAESHAATYDVSLRAQGSEWVGDVDLMPPTGDVAFHFAAGNEPPAACVAIVRAAVRAIYREHERAGFPRRVTRWRPLPTSEKSP